MKLTTKLTLLLFVLYLAAAPGAAAQSAPPVLAFYYAWFDQNTWTSGQSVDLPATSYNSADPATIQRHVAEARGAGIDALVQSWYGPQVENNQTETNFGLLLDAAQSQGMQATVAFETTGPFFPDSGSVTGALSTLLATHAQHPAFFRRQGKPVIFFWRQQRFSVDEWQAIRDQVDPNHNTLWIAEGTDISYQSVFDGHHLYSIAWAESPAAQLAKWGDRVRAFEADNSVDRLWVATAMPGYDDTRLPRADAFSVARRNGDYYRQTWNGAVASNPDMIIITSFNEWPEGTHIEPSQSYGNLYLDITRELVTALKGSPPPAPLPEIAAQSEPPTAGDSQDAPPDGPYIQIDGITNARRGPSTDFEIVGRLASGTRVPVTGQTAAGDWWQIEFEGQPAWVAGEVVDFFGDSAAVPVVEAPAAPDIAPETSPAEPTAENLAPATEVPAVEAARVTVPSGGVNVRSGPGLDFDLLGKLDEGDSRSVLAVDETGRWWQIEFEGQPAWVADAVVEFSGNRESVPPASAAESAPAAETATPTPTPPLVAGSVRALDAINVRAEPSTGGALLGGMYLDETADVLAVSEDGGWWQIEFGGEPAWVSAEFVEFSGDETQVPVFGAEPPTPTPPPTATPAPTQTPTAVLLEQPTLAPTPTSEYQATSAALLAERGTPQPDAAPATGQSGGGFSWQDIPWGILALVIIAGFLIYQFVIARRKRR